MANTLQHSPAHIVAQLLADLGLGADPTAGGEWPVSSGAEPASPDNVITVYDTDASDYHRLMPTGQVAGHSGLQVRVRGKTHPVGWAKADQVQTAMAVDVYGRTVRVDGVAYTVTCFSKIGNIRAIGHDPGTRRKVFVFNAEAVIGQA